MMIERLWKRAAEREQGTADVTDRQAWVKSRCDDRFSLAVRTLSHGIGPEVRG